MGDMAAAGSILSSTAMLAAGSPGGQSAAFSGLLWLGGIVLFGLLVVIVAIALRRQAMGTGDRTEPPFTLEDLRRMRDAGDLTNAQYDALRRDVIDRYQRPVSDDR